ncbi:MAG: hypothetical protein ACK4YU_05820 [Paracoccus sp. (in: a-proteobacteria)]
MTADAKLVAGLEARLLALAGWIDTRVVMYDGQEPPARRRASADILGNGAQ